MSKLVSLQVSLYRLPLAVPVEASAAGVMAGFDMVMVRLQDDQGCGGCGYTVLHQGQGAAVAAVIDGPFRELLISADPRRIEWLWQQMYKRTHYAGRGGPVAFAQSAVDVALWDLRGNSLAEPLWRLLGGYDPQVRCYAGNIDLNFPLQKLLDGGMRSVEAGFTAVKLRLGKPTLSEDIARLQAMREQLPEHVEMMADANEAWRVDQAARAMRQLQEFDLVWLEEPIAPDNTAGYRHLRSLGLVPLAAGENLHTLAEFTALISAAGVDFPEPDLTTCGGITPFMKVARLAEAHGLPVTSHGAHDLHVHLLAACPNRAYLEWHAFGLDQYMAEPLRVEAGYATAPDRAGHGIVFDRDKLDAFRV